jgi:ferredoxin
MVKINRKHLNQWLNKTAKTSTLVAPCERNGILLYKSIEDSSSVVWDFTRPILSAKDTLFPATDRLLSIEKTGQTIEINEFIPSENQILFGIRPCDARGISALDALFLNSDPPDVVYTNRRQNTVVIGLACNQMGDTCFCTSTGGGPDDPTGMDIMLKETNGKFEVQILTDTGAIFAKNEWGLDAPEIMDSDRRLTSASDPEFKMPEKTAWPPQFNDDFWATMAERCLSCRICAYVCPTCRCFDVRDEEILTDNGSRKYERIRCWDSCAGEKYRRIAGGHNPRSEKGQRLRNRFFCKFYYYPDQYSHIGCTGCGRCIDYCPVNIDITEVMSHITENAA